MTTEAAPAPTKPRLVVRIVTILVSLLMALVIAEVALRIMAPARTKHLLYPPGTHHTFKPRPDLFPDFTPETTITINSAGLRGPEIGHDGEELRVLAIGGSTTECLYHDDSKVWTGRIGQILGEGGGKHVWSGGAGRSGMNSGDHVLAMKYLLDELPHIDTVVVLAGVNDVNVALAMPDTYVPMPVDIDPAKHEKEIRRVFVQVPGTLEHSWDYDASFLKRTQLFQLVRRLARKRSQDLATHHLVNDDTGKSMTSWRENRQKATKILTELPDLTKALATYRANLNAMADLAAAKGVRLVLLTQPTLWRADLSEAEQKLIWMGGTGDYMKEPGHEYYSVAALTEAMRKFNDTMLSVCKDRGIGCVDLAKEIPASTEVFYDDCHFGHTGSEKIAQAVASFLKKEPPFTNK